MTSVHPAELVRVSVHGPAGRADLAVPVSTTVANLLPALLRHTGGERGEQQPGTDWVLQRLGGAPLDPDGTPETHDWLAGEQLYLRPAAHAAPELHFDDVADGVATAVQGKAGRWRPGFNKALFLAVAALFTLTAALLVALPGITPTTAATLASAGALLGLGGLVASALAGQDRWLVGIAGFTTCVFGWLAVVGLLGRDSLLTPGARGVAAGAAVVAVCAVVVLAVRASMAPELPMLPFGVLAFGGVVLAVGLTLPIASGLAPAAVDAMVTAILVIAVVIAPRVMLRLARLHAPQLPRTSAELQNDIEPLPAGQVSARTANADRYLSVLVVVTAAAVVISAVALLATPGWAGAVLTALFGASMALRARVHTSVAQRLSFTGAALAVAVLVAASAAGTPDGRWLALGAVLAGVVVSVFGAVRPTTRRSRPVWAHLANIAESLITVAVLPVLLQVLGVYAWARGLAG